jgi:hypothetical protein
LTATNCTISGNAAEGGGLGHDRQHSIGKRRVKR